MATPTEQHKNLARMAGQWNGEETMHPSPWDPAGGPASSLTRSRLELGGFYIVQDYAQSRGGMTTYTGHGVFGYDPQKQKYLMYWFDGYGCDMGGPALGDWVGDRLTFTHKNPMGYSRFVYDFSGEGQYRFQLDHSPDGKSWRAFVEGTYRKTGP